MLADDLEKSKKQNKQNTHSVCRSLRSYILLKRVKNLEPHSGHLFKLKSAECALDFFNGPVGEAVFFRAQSTDSTLVQYGRGNNTCNSSVLDQTFLFLEVVRGQKNNEMMMMMMMENRRGRLAEITQNGKGKKNGACVPRLPIQLPQRCSSVCLRSVAIKWRRL